MILGPAKALQLREGVELAYSVAAKDPVGQHAFPIGRGLAISVGYPEAVLSALPACSVDRFAGVSSVSIFAEVDRESTVLDLGCGAGLDSLIASSQTGPRGKVTGVDFSAAMLENARAGAEQARAFNTEFHQCDGDNLPFPDGSFDVALFNGIFNLTPDRESLFRELARVVRPGGVVHGAELVLRESVTDAEREAASWFA